MARRLALVVGLLALLGPVPQAQTVSWRPTIMGTHGMVAAGHPLAAEVGLRVLKAGGNAVDAAVAAWAIQGQVEPGMTGLGADMFALVYLAKTREVKFINGTGFAPKAATIDYYLGHGGMPDDSGLSIAVPGAVSGVDLMLRKYGTKPMAEVLAPAIEVAHHHLAVVHLHAGYGALFPGIAAGQIALDLGQQVRDRAVFLGVAGDAALLRGAAGCDNQRGTKGKQDVAGHGRLL